MTSKHIIMVAAENGALPHGKIGGIGDVIRDVPGALADRGWRVSVLTPSYGLFARLPGARHISHFAVSFGGSNRTVNLYEVPGLDKRITHLVLDSAAFSPGGKAQIYHDDGPNEPFKTDSTKFAFFCASAGKLLGDLQPDIIHVHDWHTGLLLALRAFEPDYSRLRAIPTYFTIHNLALQGIRPLKGHSASLREWFPDHVIPLHACGDPRYEDCVNPMATAIRLADRVHVVSPTYATEVVRPNGPGFHGGEGLEGVLQQARKEQRLVGILNGCSYPARAPRKVGWKRLLKLTKAELSKWIAKERLVHSAHWIAEQRIKALPSRRPDSVITSVGRITDQKVQLLLQPTSAGSTPLSAILKRLGSEGLFVLLGSGTADLEQALTVAAAQNDNFLYLQGYSDTLAQALYQTGDLFLMPSSFEPCGISQMLALQAGQPCVVHGVGGLRDTVKDGETGFVFDGNTLQQQAARLVASVGSALDLQRSDPEAWQKMRTTAAAERFTWEASTAEYERLLYQTHAH